MTSIPAQHSGGGVLTYTYYANDQVRTIAQDGVSKTYSLDPTGRQRQTVASGGTTHTETLHYRMAPIRHRGSGPPTARAKKCLGSATSRASTAT